MYIVPTFLSARDNGAALFEQDQGVEACAAWAVFRWVEDRWAAVILHKAARQQGLLRRNRSCWRIQESVGQGETEQEEELQSVAVSCGSVF